MRWQCGGNAGGKGWRCGENVVAMWAMWWQCGGNVVAMWWQCGGNAVAMRWEPAAEQCGGNQPVGPRGTA
eukprot:7388554-Prymnesium_polylepis.1